MVEDYQTIEKAGEVGEGYNENKEMGAQTYFSYEAMLLEGTMLLIARRDVDQAHQSCINDLFNANFT